MKILMTADTIGGVWTYSLELVRALRDYGVDVALATMGAPLRPAQREQVADLQNVTLYESTLRLEWMPQPWDDVERAGEWLLEIERLEQPDLVHLNGYVHASLPWSCPILVVAHSCVLSWWSAVRGEAAPDEWDRYRVAVGRGLRSADLVLAPSQAMLNAVQRHYGFLTSTGVVPNGRDPSLFHERRKEPFVFSAGRLWDEAKNLEALNRIAPRLQWPVYVAGPTDAPDGASRPAPNVRPLGLLESGAVSDWLARAAIYALPARYEPFGLSVLEAALSGCALVLGDIPSLREVWSTSALYVVPDDPGALRQTLAQLIRNPILRMRMAARARARGLRYSPRRMAEGYLDAYRELLPASKRTVLQTA